MSILSTNQRLISIGESYSAGNGIDITDQIISVTGDATPYSAGDNIDIQDHIISGKDWSQDITDASANAYSETTAWVQENYANSADMTYISGVVDNKLDTTAWSTVSGNLATEDYVIMADNINYNQMSAFVINQHYASESNLNSAFDYLNANKLDNSAFNLPNSAKWNESTNVVETNSAAWFDNVGDAEVNNFVYTNSSTINDVNSTVQTNSAQWSENTGDEEVNNAVYNNSAKWNDISVYQTNSASYLTAHQDISNKLDTTAFSTVSGTFLTAHQDLSNYATTGDLNSTSGILSGAIDYLSGNAGKTYTGISPIVVNNDTNEISADSQDITFGSGLDFTNGVLTVTAGGGGTTYTGDAQGALDEVYANSGVWLTAHQDISNKLDTTAFSTVSGNFLTAVDLTPYYTTADANTLSSMLSGAIDYVSANAGDEFPASANEAITAYQNASGTYLTAHQPISANEWNNVYETVETNSGSWAGGTSLTGDAQGAVDEVYTNSANWNDNYSTVTTNSASWGGTPLPMSAGDGIDIQIENDTLVISATGGAGNPEVESYVQTNSASIDEVVGTYETNSGTYLTAHQDISNKLDTTAFSDVSGSFLTAINIPESANWNDATTAYQTNSASYMTEPNLEYNAVGEISGYGNSAIAQYGAEKQWLQHDDTIVHVANSAQYAFGCNVSAIAQLLGVDETVLYEGTTAAKVPQSSITLSESANNFEKIDILYRDRYQNIFDSKTIHTSNMTFDNENTSRVLLSAPFLYNSTAPQYIRATQYKFSNNTTMTFETNNLIQITTSGIKCNFSTTPDNNGCYVWKVIGIGRKA